jgi:predicted deacylase
MTAFADPIEELDPFAVAAGTARRVMIPFAIAPDGAPSTYPLIVIAGGRPGPTAALVGGIHGDEFEGPSALWRLAAALDPAQVAGRILIVPLAHGAAFAAGIRTSPIDGQNLARIFPGDAGGTSTLRLAHDLFERVVAGADFLVDCHSGGVRLAFLPVAGFYGDAPGIGAEVATGSLALAKEMGLPHLWRLPGRSGVLSFEAMRRGIPAAGCEIGGRGGLLAGDSDRYLHGLQRVLAARGLMAAPDLLPAPVYRFCLEGDWALAPVGGFIDNHVELGHRVAAGTLLATISSPLGTVLARMTSATEGIVMGVRHLRSIQPGEWATCVVAEAAL